MKVKQLIRLLLQDGWYLVAIKGSHYQFKHQIKLGKVTVPSHSRRDLALGTLRKICKDAQLCTSNNHQHSRLKLSTYIKRSIL